MFTASFIWQPGVYDVEFHRLNAILDELAKSLPDFLGVEIWVSADGDKRNATYYWRTMETLKLFATHPTHQEAKRQYGKWYNGYHIVISEVIRTYGDNAFAHITPNDRKIAA
jgi:heme-degrading monooxygenase HmoA